MDVFESLIAFLEKKALDINRSLKDKSIVSDGNLSLTLPMLRTKIIKQNNNQILIQKIIELLFTIAEVRKKIKNERQEQIKFEFDCFLDTLMKQVVEDDFDFTKIHPLFGFQPFHDKLINHYTELEYFEKCSSIIKVTEPK